MDCAGHVSKADSEVVCHHRTIGLGGRDAAGSRKADLRKTGSRMRSSRPSFCSRMKHAPENHQLLERAYFLRARQLFALGMPDSAIEVAEHLLEFGLTTERMGRRVCPAPDESGPG